jgi:hypothetical protein
VIPGQVIVKYIPIFIEFPPMQAGGSFNVSDLKEKVEQAAKAARAGSESLPRSVVYELPPFTAQARSASEGQAPSQTEYPHGVHPGI